MTLFVPFASSIHGGLVTRVEEFEKRAGNALDHKVDVGQPLNIAAKPVAECTFEIPGSGEALQYAQLMVIASASEPLHDPLPTPD